ASKPDSFNWYGTTMYYTPVFVDSRNRVFILPKSKFQIWWYHPQEKRIEVIADSLSSVATYFVEDKQGKLWFSTYKQLLRWNPDHSWTDYSMVLKDALEFASIRGIYEDKTNLLWIATDNGLIKLPNNSQLFRTKFNKPGENWGNAMRGIFDDQQGRIYAYCERGQMGLHCLDPLHGQLHDTMNTRTVRPDILLFEGAKHFIPDRKANTVWFLTDHLIEMDLARMSVKISVDLNGIADKSSLNPLARLEDNTFLLGGTLARLTICNTITREQKKLIRDTSTYLANVYTEYFLENQDGSIWVGTTNDGLYLIRRDGQIMRHLTIESTPDLSNNHLLVLYHNTDSILWIGTFGGGLNRLNLNKNTIDVFTQKEGLANENVTGILSDLDGNIWISTYNGLSCYRIKERSFQNFFEDDGLSNNEFNYSSFFKDRKGWLWFGGMNGVQYFDPSTIMEQRPNPPLTFTGYLKYNRLRDSVDARVLGSQEMKRVIISPYDSYFQFSWTLPNYFKPDKNRYYVWLEGLEDNWTYIGNTPTVRYNKLSSGNYTLHIKGADSKGNWSETELTVPILVKPFFYSTWWFILGCILLIGSLVYAFTRYRLQRLLEMERMRTRIAGDLHDEVGSMLSGLAMQAEILELDPQKSDTVRLHRLSEISRMTLSKMRDVVWSIDSRRDQVKDLLDRMREHAEEMLTAKEISFQFELGELPLEKKLQVDVRQHLFLFFKEAITNIVKHSNATIVTIRFGQFGDHFELSVEDNGTSFSSADSTGFGLQNMEMRAKKLGASFELKRDHGFQVKLKMKPL
ncbi:MAG: triple tyrosine motif-containing protein, partial [Saprospiraceae bacterium]